MEQQENKERYHPSIKEVLRNFQATAVRSLNGPSSDPIESSLVLTGSEARTPSANADRRFRSDCAPGARSARLNPYNEVRRQTFSRGGPCPVDGSPRVHRFLQTPLLLPQDSSVSETTETILEGETISCFAVGGEKRLCVPEVLRKVLNSFNLSEIHHVYEELHIFTSLCSHAQLCTLKRQGTLPASAATCGLITQTYAERLCSTLLRRLGTGLNATPSGEAIRVLHRCFGKCAGVFYVNFYTSASAHCIRCCECNGFFSPPEFVCHAHESLENRTCHWGFDSTRWRNYVTLTKGEKRNVRAQQILDDVKALFDYSKVYKRCLSRDHCAEITEEKLAVKKKPCPEDRDWTGHVKEERNDRCFAPNVSLVPASYAKCDEQREMCDSEEEGYGGCLTLEHGLPQLVKKAPQMRHPVNLDPRGSTEVLDAGCLLPGRIKDLEVESASAAAEQSGLWEAELCVFSSALEQAASLSAEAKQHVVGEYIGLQHRHLSLAKKLIGIQRTLQQELVCLHGKMNKSLEASEAEKRAKEQELLIKSQTNRVKLDEAKEDNNKLQEEIEAIINGSKRSDIGLMKAKYKAQVEHFRRKLQSMEQSNEMLVKKHSELQDSLRHLLPPTLLLNGTESASATAASASYRARCHSTGASFAPA